MAAAHDDTAAREVADGDFTGDAAVEEIRRIAVAHGLKVREQD
jgi:hypothetical protein